MIYCSQMRQLSPFYDTVAAFMHIFSFLFRVGRIFFTCSFAVHLSIKYIFIFTENIFLKYFAWFIIHKEVIMKILSNSPGVLWDCHMHSEFSADSGTPTRPLHWGLRESALQSIWIQTIHQLRMTWNLPWIFPPITPNSTN